MLPFSDLINVESLYPSPDEDAPIGDNHPRQPSELGVDENFDFRTPLAGADLYDKLKLFVDDQLCAIPVSQAVVQASEKGGRVVEKEWQRQGEVSNAGLSSFLSGFTSVDTSYSGVDSRSGTSPNRGAGSC